MFLKISNRLINTEGISDIYLEVAPGIMEMILIEGGRIMLISNDVDKDSLKLDDYDGEVLFLSPGEYEGVSNHFNSIALNLSPHKDEDKKDGE